jgi:A/G-specific adenine glycosylase
MRRNLPWRRTRDPYRIWVSEAMLQQTRVAAVLPRYRDFLRRFPTIRELASARREEVLAAWSGLGYYRRAASLHEAARRLVRDHGGRLPADPDRLRKLPGFGPYTSAAIASIAFGLPEPALDGNVFRVLARLMAVPGDPRRAVRRRRLETWTRSLLVSGPAGDLTQALMELGALVCLPAAPRCDGCPLAGMCRARIRGRAGEFPEKRWRRPAESRRAALALIRRGSRYLLVRRGGGGPMQGLWELPGGELRVGEDAAGCLGRVGREVLGQPIRLEQRLGAIRQAVTYRRFTWEAYRGRVAEPLARAGGSLPRRRWVLPRDLATLPHGAATRKAFRLADPARTAHPGPPRS